MPVSKLVTVNGRACDVAAALREDILQGNAFLSKAIDSLLIRQYAEKQGIRNTDQELQLAFDELRYSRDLESVDAVQQWMRENHQTLDSMQDEVDMMLLRNKVRNSFAESQIQAHFAEHQLELEAVSLYSIRVETEGTAQELLSQIRDEEGNFHLLAMEHSTDELSKAHAGYVGRLTRAEMTPVVEAEVFKAKPGAVVGPAKTDRGWNLFLVAAIHKPNLDDTKEEIRSALMEQLLTKLRSDAQVSVEALADAAGA
jgi:parvulin-like peptidyl-prolyl isomerase